MDSEHQRVVAAAGHTLEMPLQQMLALSDDGRCNRDSALIANFAEAAERATVVCATAIGRVHADTLAARSKS